MRSAEKRLRNTPEASCSAREELRSAANGLCIAPEDFRSAPKVSRTAEADIGVMQRDFLVFHKAFFVLHCVAAKLQPASSALQQGCS